MTAPRLERRMPRWSEFAPLLKMQRGGSRLERRLNRAPSIADLRLLAEKRAPRGVFDYVDGAAGQEESLRRSTDSFGRVEFRTRVLRDVGEVSTESTILGKPVALPLAFGPTGYTRMMHAAGETAVARVASRGGIPYALSTMGTTSIEDVAAASSGGRRWFQLYVWRDRNRSLELIRRAEAAGYEALVLTVDVPVGGGRLRDVRNGLTVPPTLTPRTFLNGARHPRWLWDFLTTPPLKFVSLDTGRHTMADVASTFFDPTVTFADLAWFREHWSGKLVVKGIMTVDDAVACADHGVDGIVVSNHGARQLDRSPTPLEILPDIAAAVGDRLEVMLDSGVRSGGDIAAAVALGASCVLVGRAYLYGLMAGGEAGVQRAYDLLAFDFKRTLQLLGVTNVQELKTSNAARLRPV